MNLAARTRFLPLAGLLLVLTGCVSTSFHPAPGFEVRQAQPVSPDSIHILRSAPSQPYVTLGEIEAWISGFPSNETAMRRTREAAAAVGADAIFRTGGSLFADEPGSEGESVSPRTVSFTFVALRYANPPHPSR